MTAKDELTNALARRYAVADRVEKTRILDEFVAITGFHRKHAMRRLRSGVSGQAANGRVGRRIYGEARPTAKPPKKPKRERRRPDPLVKVTEQLRAWFEAEPWSTSRQLLEKLQAAHPGEYPDNLLRTLQRRVKVWRREKATAMVFGELPDVE